MNRRFSLVYDDGLTLLTEIFSEKIFRDFQRILSSGLFLIPIILGPPTLERCQVGGQEGRAAQKRTAVSPLEGKGWEPFPWGWYAITSFLCGPTLCMGTLRPEKQWN